MFKTFENSVQRLFKDILTYFYKILNAHFHKIKNSYDLHGQMETLCPQVEF